MLYLKRKAGFSFGVCSTRKHVPDTSVHYLVALIKLLYLVVSCTLRVYFFSLITQE
jgi:hypothetical protein